MNPHTTTSISLPVVTGKYFVCRNDNERVLGVDSSRWAITIYARLVWG